MNFGWAVYEGRAPYDPSRALDRRGPLVWPIAVYSHSQSHSCSVTGGFVYRGAAVPAAKGRYFYGDYCSGTIWSFKAGNGRLSGPQVEGSKIDGLSSFGEDGNGELYAVSVNDGTLYRLR
jgi:hypothetical protein